MQTNTSKKFTFLKKNKVMPTIGIPKGLFYFQHHLLWSTFFHNLGCSVIFSEDTNKEILDSGVRYCSNETCLPIKVFHGHVVSLKDKVDYVFIPRYISMGKNTFTCPHFCGLPDMTRFNLKQQIKVLEVKIHLNQSSHYTSDSLFELSKTLHLPYHAVMDAFIYALFQFNQRIIDVSEESSSCHTKISVLGHPYMLDDNYISMNLIHKLSNQSIQVLTPNMIDYKTKRSNAYPFYDRVFWDVGFNLLGSAYTFAENKEINGVIYLTPFGCGPDSLIIEFIERRFKSNYKIPFLKLTVDEHTGEAGFDTRLEAFLDILRR